MATKIIHKKSSVSSSVPVAGSLEPAEIAINLADKKIFSKTVDGTIIELADGSKLDGIEAGATADQTKADIDALGINADTVDGQHASAFALSVHTHTGVYEPADATILKDADIGSTVQAYSAVLAATTASFTTADNTKLGGIESGATADQTKADIDALNVDADTLDGQHASAFALSGHNHSGVYEPADGTILKDADIGVNVQAYSAILAGTTASFTSADNTKLDGIEAGANVTDTANVTAAGALMDSEVTNLAQVKAFSSTDYATAAQGTLADSAVQPNDSPTFDGLTVDTSTLVVDSTNNRVGIGTSNPSEKLTVVGNGVFGNSTTKYNAITINGNHVNDGDNDYGLTINSFEPAITLIDRSTGSGSTQLFGTNNGGLWLVGDTLNDGTIGHTANTTDFLVAKFEPINTIFYTAGAESVRINASGNVGIGTASPTTELDVVGTITATSYEGDGSALTGIAAGAGGGGSDEIFWENGQNVTTNYTITNGKNAMSAGPITIDSGVTVTVGAGETWTVV